MQSQARNLPFWLEEAPLEAPCPEGPQVLPACDVAVIGAGFTGLAAALELARAGRSVQVFDRAAPGEGASRRILIAPYVGYMRQDAVFRPGEALSQAVVGKLLGRHADRIVTVDVHLHRTPNLWAVFRRPGRNLHAAPLFAPRTGSGRGSSFRQGTSPTASRGSSACRR